MEGEDDEAGTILWVGSERFVSSKHLRGDTCLDVIPSRGLTYPTLGKGKSSSKWHFLGIC